MLNRETLKIVQSQQQSHVDVRKETEYYVDDSAFFKISTMNDVMRLKERWMPSP